MEHTLEESHDEEAGSEYRLGRVAGWNRVREMPGGYAGQAGDPAAAAREAREETGWRLPDPARAGIDVTAHDRKCRLTPGSVCCTPDKGRGLPWICS
jgi:8-oxo-dGTP pyrophosphatase MutT (NUDIX family)